MTFEEFDTFQNALFRASRQMKETKGREYALSKDRFDNFNRLAQRLGLSRQMVLWIYLHKHLDAIESVVRNGRTFSEETAQGRIVDAITYLTLLAGMWREEIPHTPVETDTTK